MSRCINASPGRPRLTPHAGPIGSLRGLPVAAFRSSRPDSRRNLIAATLAERTLAMLWSRRLPNPVILKDGRRFDTLRDAANFILALPERGHVNPNWRHASELLMAAAQGSSALTEEFATKLKRALKADGLI